jgi:hypothetical protein
VATIVVTIVLVMTIGFDFFMGSLEVSASKYSITRPGAANHDLVKTYARRGMTGTNYRTATGRYQSCYRVIRS